ncbi:MAG: phospholipase D-like domain-containing protein [Deltaproteobacteria bacterium]|nr:phospholipase D-like domain-containing protein [Deltaproteobacteria bacterium]
MLPPIFTHLATIVGFLLAALVIAHMFRQRHSPAATTAWLLAMVLLPYVGVPLYLLLGGRKMLRAADSKGDIRLPDAAPPSAEAFTPFDALLRTYGIPAATEKNRLTLCRTGEDGYSNLVRLIEQARETIYITTFILASDEVGKDIITRLTRKAEEGVSVKVLVDGVGAFWGRKRALRPLVKAGGQVNYFFPVFHLPTRGRTNLRNHRKMVIVDEERVMAGGTNIAKEYIGPRFDPKRWHDLSFVLEGPAVRHYIEVFRSDWKFASGESIHPNQAGQKTLSTSDGDAVVQVVPSGPDVPGDPLYDTLLSIVFAAKRRLWIVTPYFVPDEALSQAMSVAAHRGVDLRILVPEKSNHRLADLARGTYLRDIQGAGGHILLYTKGMVHAKVLLMDHDLIMIGSANLDMRSLFLNYETALFAYSKGAIQDVETWIMDLEKGTRTGVKDVGTLRDLGEGVVRMVAPLL